MIASWYAPQIFWVLVTALEYTLLALAVAEKDNNDEQLKENVNKMLLEWTTYPQCPV